MLKSFIKYLSILLLLAWQTEAMSQNSIWLANDSSFTVYCDSSCSGVIYDDGGPNGNYGRSFYGSVTIYYQPGDTLFVWGSYRMRNNDYLYLSADNAQYYRNNGQIDTFFVNGSLYVSLGSGNNLWTDQGFVLHYEVHRSSCNNGISWFDVGTITATTAYVSWNPRSYTSSFRLTINGVDTILNSNYCYFTNLSRNTAYSLMLCGVVDTGSAQCYHYLGFNTSRCDNEITSLTSVDVSATSVTLAWASETMAGSYLVSNGTRVDTVTGTTYTYSGLHPNRNYTFTVKSIEDTCCSSCSQSYTVRTLCYQAKVNGLRPLIGVDTVTLVADSADAYLWNTGETTRSISVTQAGYYTLIVYTNGGCSDTLTVGVSDVVYDIDLDLPPYICSGDSLNVHVGLSSTANIHVNPGTQATLSDPSTIFLPDGINCNPNSSHGCSYRSELEFSGFGNHQLITDVNDIMYVMLHIEHSYIADLYINITCPNGQNADILKFSSQGSSPCTGQIGAAHRNWSSGSNCGSCFLGLPLDYEDDYNPCDSSRSMNRAGVGWRYCWSNSTDAGYSYAPGDGIIYRTVNSVSVAAPVGGGYYTTFDSSDVAAGTNFYHPDQSLASLVGCPMNGDWYIEVIDGWSGDNGYIFGWELALNPERLSRTQYEPTVARAVLDGQNVSRTSDTTFTITAPTNLTSDTTIYYTVHIYDTAGNLFDTTFAITFHPQFARTVFDTVVENQLPRTVYGISFTTDTANLLIRFANPGTCDSLITYNLHVIPNQHVSIDSSICDSQLPFVWNTKTFTTAGIDSVVLPSYLGADSIVTMRVSLYPTYSYSQYDTICDNQTFTFEGQQYSAAGTYPVTYHSANGCDSVRRLFLVVNPTSSGDSMVTACDRFVFGNATYTAEGLDTIHVPSFGTNIYGCDSSTTIYLTLHHSSSYDVQAVACDSYDWYGRTLTSTPDSVLTHTTTNSVGCDSIVRLQSLSFHYTQYIIGNDTACISNLSSGYSWHDTTILSPASGTYTYVRHDAIGCDSIYSLSLVVLDTLFTHIYDTIVENQASAWTFMGVPVTTDTMFSVALTSAAGCDSVVYYHLYVWRNVSVEVDTDICADALATFRWNGQSSSLQPLSGQETGIMLPPQFDTLSALLHTVHGADSMVTLRLRVYPTYNQELFDTICSNQTFSFGSSQYSTAGQYSLTLPTLNGCDSVLQLHLHVHPAYTYDYYDTIYLGDTVTFHGERFFEPGEYPVVYTTQLGCDSVFLLHLTGRNMHFAYLADSLCEGDSLFFGGKYVGEAGTYFDTIFTGDFYRGDTVVCLSLKVLALPVVSIDSTHECYPEPSYILSAHASVPYFRWWSRPLDGSLLGHEHDTTVSVYPADSTFYYFYADYAEEPLCPVVDSILMPPLNKVSAAIEVVPQAITLDDRHITAHNRSTGRYVRHLWYVWYDGVQAFTSTETTLSLDVPATVDSVQLSLQVFSHICADVITVDVPVRRSGIFFPNFFTPTLDINNRFLGVGSGVIDFEIWIYDRQGILVYHSTDMHEGWDGTKGGILCRQGTYVYYCRYTDQVTPIGVQTAKGTVTLVR